MTLKVLFPTFSPSDVVKMESQPKTVSVAGGLSLVVCINEVTFFFLRKTSYFFYSPPLLLTVVILIISCFFFLCLDCPGQRQEEGVHNGGSRL